MQVSSLLHTATLLVSLASALGVATLAYADSPGRSDQPVATASQPAMIGARNGAMHQRGMVSNTGPYDSPDFVVPKTNIYP